MTDVFEEIKSRLNIQDVAHFYGIKISHKNKAFCPFHEDKHPSLSFKNNKLFKCFACEAKGSVICLVMKLFNLTALQASKKLSEDFNLGLFEEKLSPKRWKEIQKQNQKRKTVTLTIGAYMAWKEKTEKWFIYVFRNLLRIFISYTPKNFEEPHKAWNLAVDYMEHIEEILEKFRLNSREQILDSYDIINAWKDKIQKEIEAL